MAAFKNIEEASSFDRTARGIISYGIEKSINVFRENIRIKENGCWDYKKTKHPAGYSMQPVNNKKENLRDNLRAHRFSWLLSGMKVTKGLVLDHKCNNKWCVNPFHLREVTHAENTFACSYAPATMNKNKTHCIRGHEFSKENTYHWNQRPRTRMCKTCMRDSLRERRRAKKCQQQTCLL